MKRPLVAGLVLATVIAVPAAVLLRPGRPVVQTPPASAPVHIAVRRAEPGPPLAGRVAIAPAQLAEAEATGLVDRPIKSLLDVPQRMTYGDFVWNDKGVPAGPVWVRVDLAAQILSVFRSGHEIGTAVILYGTDGLPTPTGKFPILAKYKDHRSATYGDAPMPFTLRLTSDGVSIHGSNVRWGFATHGCIGIPTAFAAKLFDAVAPGTEVVIVQGKSARESA